jgi:ribosomal protein L14E/L6E/L27E
VGPVIGQLVSSRAGRDAKRKYLVIELLDSNFVLIADGYTRKVSQPKKKNIKHLVIHRPIATDIATAIRHQQKITNQQIRASIASLTCLPEGREEASSDNG